MVRKTLTLEKQPSGPPPPPPGLAGPWLGSCQTRSQDGCQLSPAWSSEERLRGLHLS